MQIELIHLFTKTGSTVQFSSWQHFLNIQKRMKTRHRKLYVIIQITEWAKINYAV